MGSLGLLGIGCLIASCAAVGLRLSVLGVRGRRLPEFALGLGYLLFGAVGYPLAAVARASGESGNEQAGLWLAAALAVQNLGVVGCFVFNWMVFRSGIGGATAVAAGTLLLATSWIGQGFDPGWPGAVSAGPWYYTGLATRAAAFLWGGMEAFSQWRMMRLRMRIGLADPSGTHLMLLWGVSSAIIALAFGVFLVAQLGWQNVTATPIVLSVSATGIASSIAMTLAFFPPAFYRRWLLQRTGDGDS